MYQQLCDMVRNIDIRPFRATLIEIREDADPGCVGTWVVDIMGPSLETPIYIDSHIVTMDTVIQALASEITTNAKNVYARHDVELKSIRFTFQFYKAVEKRHV